MPRKAASDAAAADSDAAPRRSTRISSQPATATKEVVKEKKPKAESKAGKKREAEDEGKGEAPSKKVRFSSTHRQKRHLFNALYSSQ
jgi:hypothetical protein